MHKYQRHGSIAGAIENALDDLRHTWERLWFDRKVTGEVDMFKANPAQAHSTAEMFDQMYGRKERGEDHAPGREPADRAHDREAEEIER